jgi:hypothetical protein
VIHRREQMTTTVFRQALEVARRRVLLAATCHVPDTKHARNLAKRFRENGEAYFRFITTPGIGPRGTRSFSSCWTRFKLIYRALPRLHFFRQVLDSLPIGPHGVSRLWLSKHIQSPRERQPLFKESHASDTQ